MELPLQLQQFALEVLRLAAWFLLLMVIFVPLERFWSLHSIKTFRKGFLADLGYYFLSSLSALLPKLLLIFPLSMIALGAHRFAPTAFYEWVGSLPIAIRLALALVVGEVGFYWGHRWMHQIPALWRFHVIHHSAEEVDWLVNTRAHPVDIVFTRLCGLVPMYVLGLAQPFGDSLDLTPVLVTIVSTVWGFFIHSNVRWRFGWLEWFVASPGFHHWHHTNDGPEVLNKNYASMLPWVDKCFGTFYLPKKWPEKYGTDTPLAPDMLGQLLLAQQPPAQRTPTTVPSEQNR